MTAYDYVFPVIGGTSPSKIHEIYGTAFSLSNHFFITNEHVMNAVLQQPFRAIGFTEGNQFKYVTIDAWELFSSIDIAVFSTRIPKAKNVKWHTPEEAMLSEVQTTGYPYALNPESQVVIRSFQGKLVTARTWYELSGKPRVYELPFPCPRGLSGAPLWKIGNSRSLPVLGGIIFGNSISEMVVYREREMSKDGTDTIIFEKTEALHLGLAVQSQSVVTIQSSLLGTSIYDFLVKNNLLEA